MAVRSEAPRAPAVSRRSRQLEAEVEILRTAATQFGKTTWRQRDSLSDRHTCRRRAPGKLYCRLLDVSSPGYRMYKTRPMSPTRMRGQWFTGRTREVHNASRQTYGSRRVHAGPTRGMDILVGEDLVAELMRLAGLVRLPGPAKVEPLKAIATACDLVHRKFHRLSPKRVRLRR